MKIDRNFLDSKCVPLKREPKGGPQPIPDGAGSSAKDFEDRLSITFYAIIAVISMVAIFFGASHLAAHIKYRFPFAVEVDAPNRLENDSPLGGKAPASHQRRQPTENAGLGRS